MALVVSILKGETSVAEAARMYGLTVDEWREKFLLGLRMPCEVGRETKRR